MYVLLQLLHQLVMSRYKDIDLSSRQEQPRMHNLIKELLKVWSSKKVEDRYQNHFLVYLDALSKAEAEMAIAKEIRLTLENQSHFFKIKRAIAIHKNILSRLVSSLNEAKYAKQTFAIDMRHFATLLDELRSNNLQVAQAALNFNYECLGNGRKDLQLIQGNNYVFQEINASNDILKNSFLSEYIAFSNSYDPFFMFHYQNSKKILPSKVENQQIQHLFSLSVSKAYKFMRTQEEIIQFLSGRIPNKLALGKIKRLNQFIDEKLPFDHSNDNIFKLKNNAYIKKYEEQSPQFDGFIQRAKTQQSPLKGVIFNTRNPKRGYTNYLSSNSPQLPKLENIKKSEFNPVYTPLYNFKTTNYRKLSHEDSINKYTFKIRRRMSVRNNANGSPSLHNDRKTQGYLQSINQIMRREQQFLKYSDNRHQDSLYQQKQSFSLKIDKDNEDAEVQEEVDAEKQDPLLNRYHQPVPVLKIEPIHMEKQAQLPARVYKNFKLKAGNLKADNVFIFLQQLNIKQYYRHTFEVQNWLHLLKNSQYYLHKFYINDVLEAISLSCALPNGDILVKYWAPLQTCDLQMSNYLFKRYLEYIQKNSMCKIVYYSISEIPELFSNGFERYNEKLLARYRTIPQQIDTFNYFPFLTLNFSIIAVPKSIGKEAMETIIIKSNKVVPFNQKQFVCFNYLLIANKIINLASGFSSFATYTPNIKNFKEVGTKLIKEEIYQTSYNMDLIIPSTNLMTLRLRHPIFSPFFVAMHPLIKFKGEEIYSDEQSLVASLQMVKNTKIYFGKGFSSINSMITVIKNRNNQNKKIQFCVRMFSKRIRGRLLSINLRDEYCFGDFEVVFEWIDFLKGKIEQKLEGFQIFGKQCFYCILEIEKQHILAFQIKPSDLL